MVARMSFMSISRGIAPSGVGGSGLGEMPCHLYTVAFDGIELWPDAADRAEAQGCTVSIDAWEPYLDPT